MYLPETLHEITDVPHAACFEVEQIGKEPSPHWQGPRIAL